MRSFDSLSEREILALAISLEEEDERIYSDVADGLREDFPASAEVFEGMRVERNAASVGKLTTRSVVESIFLIIALDAAVSIIFSVLGV